MIIAGGAIAGLGSTMSFGSAQALFPSENLGSGITDSLEPAASSTPTAGQTTAAAEPTASPTSTSTSAPSTSASAKPTTTKKATSKPTAKPTATATSATGPKDGDYTGTAKRAGVYGNVQVQIRVSGGVITAIAVPVAPSKDQESIDINSWAIPDLKAAALSSQSANIASLSGATYTSRAFASSLQSALTAAGL
jgi:uncharacterized protein with FMN-binding domain